MAGNVSDDSPAVVDRIFDALSQVERRYALYYLRDRETATVEELATVLAGWLRSRRDQQEIVTPGDRQRVKVSLHHNHLPKLEDAGFVRYDHGSGSVALDVSGEAFDEVVSEVLDWERQRTEGFVGEKIDGERGNR